MVKPEDTVRVGDTPLLRYRTKSGDADLDLTNASVLEIRFSAPSGGESATQAAVLPSGETSYLEYQCLTTTFDVEGRWEIAVRIEFPGGKRYESTVDRIHVNPSIF